VIVHPNENAQGFIESIAKPQAKKVAYQVLDWVKKLTGKTDTPVPGNANKQETSSKDFMHYLKDGTVLVKLANVLQPNSIETVHESNASSHLPISHHLVVTTNFTFPCPFNRRLRKKKNFYQITNESSKNEKNV
jgi:hypothetical protein